MRHRQPGNTGARVSVLCFGASEAQLAKLDEVSALEIGYPYELIKRVGGRR